MNEYRIVVAIVALALVVSVAQSGDVLRDSFHSVSVGFFGENGDSPDPGAAPAEALESL